MTISARARTPATEALANTAHDFGNVLQCATSAVRVCERQLLNRGEVGLAAMLGDAQEALAQAGVLALRLAGLEQARVMLSVVDVIFSMRRLLRHALGDKIVLETLVADRLPPVSCRFGDLENAVLNLAINARDAMPEGGRLIIQARPSSTGGPEGAPGVTISVSDTGCGMSPHVAEQAFTRSFSTKGPGDGRGLGLHAVSQFACDVGGSVALQSEAGSGTTVLLNLPAASSA